MQGRRVFSIYIVMQTLSLSLFLPLALFTSSSRSYPFYLEEFCLREAGAQFSQLFVTWVFRRGARLDCRYVPSRYCTGDIRVRMDFEEGRLETIFWKTNET